jgi:hypothetical protein
MYPHLTLGANKSHSLPRKRMAQEGLVVGGGQIKGVNQSIQQGREDPGGWWRGVKFDWGVVAFASPTGIGTGSSLLCVGRFVLTCQVYVVVCSVVDVGDVLQSRLVG